MSKRTTVQAKMANMELDQIKMEIDEDADDLIAFNLLDESEEIIYGKDNDPLLALTPIVYTTKLHDMNTIKKDLSKLTANEILSNLLSESKPTVLKISTKKSSPNSESIEYINRLATVVSLINYKLLNHGATCKQNNRKHNKQGRPCKVMLKNLRTKQKLNAKTKLSNNVVDNEVRVKLEKLEDSDIEEIIKREVLDKPIKNEIDAVQKEGPYKLRVSIMQPTEIVCKIDTNIILKKESRKQNPTANPSSKVLKSRDASVKIPISTNLGDESQQQSASTSSTVTELKTRNKRTENVSPVNVKRTSSRKKPRTIYTDSDGEEDDMPLLKIARKVEVANPTSSSSVPSHPKMLQNDSNQLTSDRHALIVLINKTKQAFVYRLNSLKFISDYYIIQTYDEHDFAPKYPKEEKTIEKYCCWYRRKDIIEKTCTRKNYPFVVQTFLSQPHTCPLDDCHCCCREQNTINNNSRNNQAKRQATINKSLAAAETWIRKLLQKNESSAVELVIRALNYTPEAQKTDDKIPEKYLADSLLCIKNNHKRRDGKCNFELYNIGENGDVVKSLMLDDEVEVNIFRKKYKCMSTTIRDVELCCWYKREKLMQELKMLNTSPAALKYMQKAHSCVNNQNCSCCCKPQNLELRAVEILPPIFKHTTAYEKNERFLSICFTAKSKHTFSKPIAKYDKTNKITRNKDASPAAIVLSDCAIKDKNSDLSISILSKFKNLNLGVNDDGVIEVVLDSPAKNLSVGELKILSDIIVLSKKQITKLHLSPKEFCNRINSKSGPSSRVTAFDTPLIRTISPYTVVPLQDQNDDNSSTEDHVHIADKNLNPTTKNTFNQIESSKIDTNRETKPDKRKSQVNTYLSLSTLMETKNKNYVESFKLFFNQFENSDAVTSNLHKVIPLHKPTEEFTPLTIERELSSMPIIKETFTLARPLIGLSNEPMPGPSAQNQILDARVHYDSVHANASTSTTNKHQTEHVIRVETEGRLRIKPVSELIANAPNPPSADDNIGNANISPISNWPGPIIIKREPHTNIQKIIPSTAATTVAQSLNLRKQSFIVANQVAAGSNLQLVSKPMSNTVYQLNSIVSAPATNNGAVRYLTLTPIQGSSTVQPTLTSTIVPRLVPIRPVSSSTVVQHTNPASIQISDQSKKTAHKES